MRPQTINALLDYREGKLDARHLEDFLIARDRAAGHMVDSAAFLFLEPEAVIRTFPDAKYFFVIRDCESWMVSLIDMELRVFRAVAEGKNTVDLSYHDRYARVFAPHFVSGILSNQAALAQKAPQYLPELAQFWRKFTIRVLDSMLKLKNPQRLVVRMENFNNSADRFASLAGIAPQELNTANLHLNRDAQPEIIRRLLDPKRLRAAAIVEQRIVDEYLARYGAQLFN